MSETSAAIVREDTHYPGKLLSLFEPATEAIRKGKASKPTEFGKLVKIQEAEGHIVTDYEICATRLPDQKLWEPSLKRHQELLGRAPLLATADAGFASAANEKLARELGARRVVLPTATRTRTGATRQRWFRRALRWRTGSEERISVLKRRYGLRRCRYRGMSGMERCVGFGVITSNLWVLGRAGA